MRARRTVAATAALVMVMAACGDDATPVGYTAEQLDGALLAPADVGTDFEVDDRTGGESRPPDTPAIDPGMWRAVVATAVERVEALPGD